jgi:hypothetical protein
MGYWERIKSNIKRLYKEGEISKRYSYESFSDDFIPATIPLSNSIKDECICDHKIKYNYKYVHKDNSDYFILGSCCIKKFSTVYRKERECKECNKQIRKNQDNICTDCREYKAYKEKCKCKKCGYMKKDDKYKYCYLCFRNN